MKQEKASKKVWCEGLEVRSMSEISLSVEMSDEKTSSIDRSEYEVLVIQQLYAQPLPNLKPSNLANTTVTGDSTVCIQVVILTSHIERGHHA